MNALRCPTREDHEAGRLFCWISVSVSAEEIKIRPVRGVRIHRIPESVVSVPALCLGFSTPITAVRLGELRLERCSPYDFDGTLYDYDECFDDAVRAAAAAAEQQRECFVKRLRDLADSFAAAPVSVETVRYAGSGATRATPG